MSVGFEPDIDGVTYTTGYQTLYSVVNKKDIVIHSNCVNIRGENSYSYAFKESIDTLESFSFQSNPKLVSVGNYAFCNCKKLKRVDFSKCSKLQSIGDYSFSGCSSVIDVQLPQSFLTIGNFGFQSLSSLTTIKLPKSMTSIGHSCFLYCGLTSVEFESGIKISSIPWRSFSKCNLKTITIPASVKDFVPSSLEQTNLESINVENTSKYYIIKNELLLSFDSSYVYYCPSLLSNVNIPEGVNLLVDSSFAYSKITSITLPQSLKTIESYTFNAASELLNITIPSGVIEIGNRAFLNCYKLQYVFFDEPSNLTNLSEYLFQNCESLKRIEIPDSVTSIGNNCFQNTKSLGYVKLPNNLNSLGGGVFSQTSSSIKIAFGEDSQYYFHQDQYLITSNDNISVVQFLSSSITEITIPSETLYIRQSAFQFQKQLKTIKFNENCMLKTIEDFAFDHCNSLSQIISLPSTITSIGESSFAYCSIADINLPNIEIIPQSCFQNCISLESVSFSKIKTIEKIAFANCSKLSSVNLGNMLETISTESFRETTKLEMITFPSTLISIYDQAFYNSGIKKVVFSSPELNKISLMDTKVMTQLYQRAFYYAKSLCEIKNFPSTIVELGAECFSYTNFTDITIPDDIETIGDSCFSYCPSLETFTIPETSNLETLGNQPFQGCSKLRENNATNDHFRTENGALLNYPDMNELVYYPPASITEVFSFPSNIQTIKRVAFSGCENLKIIIFPDDSKLTTIRNYAFEYCKNIIVFNIPKSLQTIGTDAFIGCNRIRCGQLVKVTDDILNNLIEDGKFPRNAIKDCIRTQIYCSSHKISPSLTIISLLFHKVF